MSDRIANAQLRSKVMTADEAAQFVNHGDKVGISGFTGAGYPKVLPTAIAERAKEAHAKGDEFMIDLFTGASTAPDCDGVLAEADAVRFRTPYQSDPIMRNKINDGTSLYADYHLSESGMYVQQGFFGPMNVAIVEAVRITEEGHIIPSSSIGNNVEYLDAAEKIIIEVNSWQSEELEGMADIWRNNPLPNRVAIPITEPGQRVGTPYIDIDVNKVVAVVETDLQDRNAPFKPLDEQSKQIAGHFLDFLEGEVAAGRLTYDGYRMQSGVGNVPNAVMSGLLDSKFENIQAYTEVIQDGMVDLIDAGKMTVASATAFSLSPEYAERMNNEASKYRESIILRPQQISNHPEVIRRLGRQLHQRHRFPHDERCRRFRGLHPQRLHQLLHHAFRCQGWCHLRHRSVCLPRGPHRTRRQGDYHRVRLRRPAGPCTAPACRKNHCSRTPGLPSAA